MIRSESCSSLLRAKNVRVRLASGEKSKTDGQSRGTRDDRLLPKFNIHSTFNESIILSLDTTDSVE
jgi:hypothetical protein